MNATLLERAEMESRFPGTPEDCLQAELSEAERNRRSSLASRLRDRWLRVHACRFAPRSELTPQRDAKIARICNRIAERIDAANPYPDIEATPRVDEPALHPTNLLPALALALGGLGR